jgi:glycosyltransferase involved in cell wall biosynthesis
MEKNNKISVIITCFNKGQFLNDCLKSVYEQTYKNWECIIINDGSSDNTELNALEWVKLDTRFKYFYQENSGVSKARNKGLQVASGDFIQFIDCDDFINIYKFEKSIKYLENDSNLIVATNFDRFDEKTKTHIEPHCLLKKDFFNVNDILVYWDIKFSIPIHSAIFPVHFFEDIKFREDLKAKEDWFFWIELYSKIPKTIFIDETLVSYRMNSTSMTNNLIFMCHNKIETIIKVKEVIKDHELLKLFYEEHLIYTLNENIELLEKLEKFYKKKKFKHKLKSFFKKLFFIKT